MVTAEAAEAVGEAERSGDAASAVFYGGFLAASCLSGRLDKQ